MVLSIIALFILISSEPLGVCRGVEVSCVLTSVVEEKELHTICNVLDVRDVRVWQT